MMDRSRPAFYKWILLSLLLHGALVFAPLRFLDTMVAGRGQQGSYPIRDLTPDFEEVALGVTDITEQSARPQADETPSEVEEALEPAPKSQAASAETPHSGDGDRSGISQGPGSLLPAVMPQFYPAKPRLIVPPPLEDIGLEVLRINIRILVGIDGCPQEIVLPDTLSNPEMVKRLTESARRFRFEPARQGDLPVESWIDLPLVLESSHH
jgi:hypothetical protein